MTRTMCSLSSFAILFALGTAPERGAEDPLIVDSKWTGTLAQKGQIDGNEVALKLEAELKVTKRDGNKFEGELKEWNDSGIKLTYLVKGDIAKTKEGKGFTVNFKSYDFKDAESQTFINIPYAGKLEGKKLAGTWKHPKNDDGITIEGDFALELSK